MKPKYFSENAYTIYPAALLPQISSFYTVETPETRFEWNAFQLFYQGKQHLFHEEYGLAMDSFKELSHLILKTVHPKLPVNPNLNRFSDLPRLIELLDPMLARTAEILKDTPVERYNFPSTIVNKTTELAPDLAKKIDKVTGAGLSITSHHGKVTDLVDRAVLAAENNDWKASMDNFNEALDATPVDDVPLRASILHDMALTSEKNNKKTEAIEFAEKSVGLFNTSRNREKQVKALNMLSGLFSRNDMPDKAKDNLDKANDLIKVHNLHQVNTGAVSRAISPNISNNLSRIGAVSVNPGTLATPAPATTMVSAAVLATPVLRETPEAPAFISGEFLKSQPATVQKQLMISGETETASIALNGNLLTGMKKYYTDLSKSADLGLVNAFKYTPLQMVAYLPHMYFYLLPMAMADCEIGMGKLSAATQRIEDVLVYPYLNEDIEVVSIWIKLADCYLDLGDEFYKNAKDNVGAYSSAKNSYEKIVKTDNSIDPNSPLYKDAKFSKIKKRVQDVLAGPAAFITAGGVTTLNENPTILWRIRQAETMLFQISSKLNFFGFDKDYVPPFSFQYLQDTARYFAQHASQMEQKYIQYKSTAENEELRYDQVAQQVELAQQSVILEKRGVAEAQAGIDVAGANRDYAETRRKNAVDSKNEFSEVRWELLEIAVAEAWASASSVDRDDQVKLTWNGHYYNSSKKRRNVVLKELADQRTRITHDLQANKLDDEIASANAYKEVANAQLEQAKTRKAVAEKRVEIAELQQKHAEENKEFLDLKEFGAGMWYAIAKKTKRLVTRYLDQATEIAFLMERAYNAETERGLGVIRYNYAPSYSGFLVGADQLTSDIDYFTFDYITNIRSRKAPVKKTISLGDLAPNAFEMLLSKGKCQFETTLADFDREFPGMYLCKIKNLELMFVGITRAVSVAGSLRNVGVSKFRKSNGNEISQLYPADVMPLSQYDIRQDALAFRFDPKDLKLFENSGLETIWELQLHRHANDFDFREILDIHLIVYYDGFHNTTLESNIIAALPTSGSASRAFSMQLNFPDELYYLRTNGEGIMDFDTGMFPYNQIDLKRNQTSLKTLGEKDAIKGLKLEVHSEAMNKTVKVTTDNEGKVPAADFNTLKNGSMIDKWTLTVPKADNPQLVNDDQLDLSGISDIIFLSDYNFIYRV